MGLHEKKKGSKGAGGRSKARKSTGKKGGRDNENQINLF